MATVITIAADIAVKAATTSAPNYGPPLVLLLVISAATATTWELQGHTSESSLPDMQSHSLRCTGRATGRAV